jgi:hypothetical protein
MGPARPVPRSPCDITVRRDRPRRPVPSPEGSAPPETNAPFF